jgi:hypothetical protein
MKKVVLLSTAAVIVLAATVGLTLYLSSGGSTPQGGTTSINYPSESDIKEALDDYRGTTFGSNIVGLGTVNCGPTNIENVVECSFRTSFNQRERFAYQGGKWRIVQ